MIINAKVGAMDNRVIERFFRLYKYENWYLKKEYEIKNLKEDIKKYLKFYNE